MIKAILSTGTVVIGLSRKNLEALLKDRPINLQMSDMGLAPLQVLIVGGETERAIYEELKKHCEIDANTLVHGLPGDGTNQTPPQ